MEADPPLIPLVLETVEVEEGEETAEAEKEQATGAEERKEAARKH